MTLQYAVVGRGGPKFYRINRLSLPNHDPDSDSDSDSSGS